MLAAVDLDAYRAEAEEFSTAIGREYLLHLSGRKDDLDIDPIYAAHAGLFTREAVAARRLGDVVIVDTTPVAASDMTKQLVTLADVVLVTCSAGGTSAGRA